MGEEFRFTFPKGLDLFCRIRQLRPFLRDYPKYGIAYPKECLVKQKAQIFTFELNDRNWVEYFANIANRTTTDRTEQEQPRTPEEKAIDNFYGLLGEKAVKDKLRAMRVLHTYNERQPDFFKKRYKEPFDFAIPTKSCAFGRRYITLEIKTTKEPANHRNTIIAESGWKKSDFVIAVKVLAMDAKAQKTESGSVRGTQVAGHGAFMGYMTREETERLPVLYGEYPCTRFAGRATELDKIPHQISELWKLISAKAVKWKP